MVPPVKESISFCPQTPHASKSTNLCLELFFGFFGLQAVLDLCIFLSWLRWDNFFIEKKKQYYGQRTSQKQWFDVKIS